MKDKNSIIDYLKDNEWIYKTDDNSLGDYFEYDNGSGISIALDYYLKHWEGGVDEQELRVIFYYPNDIVIIKNATLKEVVKEVRKIKLKKIKDEIKLRNH